MFAVSIPTRRKPRCAGHPPFSQFLKTFLTKNVFRFSFALVELGGSKEWAIGLHPQDDPLDLSHETCSLEVQGESRRSIYDWSCDQVVCGGESAVICASPDCSNCPCKRHAKCCPTCGEHFCESSDKALSTCFFEHVYEGACKAKILGEPFNKLAKAFTSGHHGELYDFVYRDSDGLGNPLPDEVCLNLGLAVAYSNGVIPELNRDVVIARDIRRRERRVKLQKRRRSARRLGILATTPSLPDSIRLAPYRSSTVHLVAGALVVRRWTGNWHYRQQIEILDIMGLSKGQDFIRDRVDFLQGKNRALFESIESWATAIKR